MNACFQAKVRSCGQVFGNLKKGGEKGGAHQPKSVLFFPLASQPEKSHRREKIMPALLFYSLKENFTEQSCVDTVSTTTAILSNRAEAANKSHTIP